MQAGRFDEAMESIEVVMSRVAAANAASFIASAESEAKMLQQLGLDSASFDVTHRRAAASIDASRRSLMERLNTAQRMAIERGAHSIDRDTRKRQLRSVIGLTNRDAKAVENFRTALETGDRAALKRARRDKRFDRTINKALSGEKPLTKEQIDRMVDRYTQKTLDDRAKEVARQESLAAHHEGQIESYAQYLDTGDITADEITVTWKSVSDGKVRDSHVHMHGQQRKEGEPFEGLHSLIRYPGDPLAASEERHGCRCYLSRKIDLSSILGTEPPEIDLNVNPDPENELEGQLSRALAPAPARGTGRATPAPDPDEPVTVAQGVDPGGTPIPPVRQRKTKSAFAPSIVETYLSRFQGDAIYKRAMEGLERVTIRSSTKGGVYTPHDHTIKIPRDWENSAMGKKWVGTFFHEVGHAVDFGPSGIDLSKGEDLLKAKSTKMVNEIMEDRGELRAKRTKPTSEMSPEANAQLQEILKGDSAAEFDFHVAFDEGNFEEAIAALRASIRKLDRNATVEDLHDAYLNDYMMQMTLDFLGAVTNLERGAGHSKAYYAQFPKVQGNVTVGNTTEAFANALLGHSIHPAFVSWMMESMAPRTIAKFRQIIEEGDEG